MQGPMFTDCPGAAIGCTDGAGVGAAVGAAIGSTDVAGVGAAEGGCSNIGVI